MKVNVNTDWKELIEEILNKYPTISAKLEEEYTEYDGLLRIFPPQCQIFNAFNYFNISELRVVIIGQDPYHGYNQANGLCFSVNKDIKIPPSLRNIFKEMKNDCNIEEKTSGDLEYLAKQGVLLLNNTLTVREGQPNSHQKIWKWFSERIISEIDSRCKNIVFLLWGRNAQSAVKHIINGDSVKNHYFLISSHPSPLSANKGGWFGSKHFSKTNEFLEGIGKTQINW